MRSSAVVRPVGMVVFAAWEPGPGSGFSWKTADWSPMPIGAEPNTSLQDGGRRHLWRRGALGGLAWLLGR